MSLQVISTTLFKPWTCTCGVEVPANVAHSCATPYPASVITYTVDDRIATLERELSEAQREARKFRKWMNCGGAPTGKKCAVDGHEIYGPFFANADQDNPICELHRYRQLVETLQCQNAELLAALKLVLSYIAAIKPTGDDPDNSEIAAVYAKIDRAMREGVVRSL